MGNLTQNNAFGQNSNQNGNQNANQKANQNENQNNNQVENNAKPKSIFDASNAQTLAKDSGPVNPFEKPSAPKLVDIYGNESSIYSSVHELDDLEKQQYDKIQKTFHNFNEYYEGMIPLNPPPKELCV